MNGEIHLHRDPLPLRQRLSCEIVPRTAIPATNKKGSGGRGTIGTSNLELPNP